MQAFGERIIPGCLTIRERRIRMVTGKPRMRTIKQAIEEIRSYDPETAFTERALRKLVADGVLPHVEIGQKFLINLDELYRFLGCTEAV